MPIESVSWKEERAIETVLRPCRAFEGTPAKQLNSGQESSFLRKLEVTNLSRENSDTSQKYCSSEFSQKTRLRCPFGFAELASKDCGLFKPGAARARNPEGVHLFCFGGRRVIDKTFEQERVIGFCAGVANQVSARRPMLCTALTPKPRQTPATRPSTCRSLPASPPRLSGAVSAPPPPCRSDSRRPSGSPRTPRMPAAPSLR